MEQWQKEYISKNIPDLVEMVHVGPHLLAHLIQANILSVADQEFLETRHDPCERNKLFLQILQTRVNAYEHLLSALEQTRQSGALKILLDGFKTSKDFPITDVVLSQSDVLHRKVIFQGSSGKLSDICKHLDRTMLSDMIKKYADRDTYIQIMKSSQYVVGKNTVPSVPLHYLIRSVTRKNELNQSAFKDCTSDIFVFTDIERFELSLLVQPFTTDTSCNQILKLNVRHIILENEFEFDEIGKLTDMNVHLVTHKENKFYLRRSIGSIDHLETYLAGNSLEIEYELVGDLLKQQRSIMCVSDFPGMGKSSILAKIASSIRERQADSIVLYIPWKEFLTNFQEMKNMESRDVISGIVEHLSDNRLGREILLEMITGGLYSLHLFLDDVDSLSEGLEKRTFFSLRDTQKQFHNIKVYVSCKPHMGIDVQHIFGVVPHKLVPLSENEQITLIAGYLENTTAFARTPTPTLNNSATQCISDINRHFINSVVDILGFPYHCVVAAQCMIGNKRNVELSTTPHIGDLIIISDYLRKIVENHFWPTNQLNFRKPVWEEHALEAIKYLFPTVNSKIVEIDNFISTAKNMDVSMQVDETERPEQINFIHHSFAEFVIAEWFFEEIIKQDHKPPSHMNLAGIVVQQIVFSICSKMELLDCINRATECARPSFKFPLLVKLINDFIGRTQGTQRESILHFFSMLLASMDVSENDFVNAIACTIIHDKLYIFRLLRDNLSSKIPLRSTYCHGLLLLSAEYASINLVVEVSNFITFERLDQVTSTFPLKKAVARGNFDVVEYFVSIRPEEYAVGNQLIHACVNKTHSEHISIVLNKVQIVKLLVHKNSELLDECNDQGHTPLLMEKIHFRLLECLINLRADVNKVDMDNSTFLHKVPLYFTPDQYHKLVITLIKQEQVDLFGRKNKFQFTPLHIAALYLNIDLKTIVGLSKLHKIDFNEIDAQGDNILFFAIRGGRSVEVIKKFVECGADYNACNETGRSVLHLCAEYGHVEALKYFIHLNVDVNLQDMHNNTCLHIVFISKPTNLVEVVAILNENGADVNICNKDQQTPIHIARSRGIKFNYPVGSPVRLNKMPFKKT